MLNNYLLRQKNEKLYCFYYTKENGLLYKIYENNKWQKTMTLLENCRDNFTVTIDENGSIYIFCQDSMGDIVLCNYRDTWNKKVILKNQASKVYPIQLNPIITEKGLCLIYNVPSQSTDDKNNYLVIQELDQKGNWSPSSRVDKFINMTNQMFLMQQISKEHSLLFYQTRTPENNIGYREITPKKQGNYNIFHTTSYQIFDTSFLTTEDSIHVLYIVKSMFSSQLIYRRKDTAQFSNSVVLWEGQKIDNCLLFFVNDNLYATYISNNQLYNCISDDFGKTFSKPIRYKNKFCANPIKAQYISESQQKENKYYMREIYVDKNNPWDIQLMPDLYEDFYPVATKKIVIESKPDTIEHKEQYIGQEQLNAENSEGFYRLKNQLEMAQKQITEKDEQLYQLTGFIKSKNIELMQITAEKNNIIKILQEEKEDIEQKYSTLLNKINTPTVNEDFLETEIILPEQEIETTKDEEFSQDESTS